MGTEEKNRRIGLLLPSSNTQQEPDFYGALPKRVTLHTTRLKLTSIQADTTVKVVEELETACRILADTDPDILVLAATAPSSRKGLGYDQELIKRISDASGKPATTASTALIESMKTLNIKRLVLGGPWGADVNEWTAKFIEASGFKVLDQQAIGLVKNLDVGRLAEQTAYDMAKKIDRPDADAIMLACGNWKTFGILDQLERELGKPVLSTNQVSLWHVLKLLGEGPVAGLGTLLSRHLPGSR